MFVTNHVPPERLGAFAALRAQMPLELVTIGGRDRHGAAPTGEGRAVRERDVAGLAASGRFSAVVCGTAGRLAVPGAFAGARRAGVPFVLWASLWAHPRTPAHLLGYGPMLAIYRGADAIVAYGEHVAAYVRARGARRVHIAPQAVDNAFWSAPAGEPAGELTALFVGRDAPEKGLATLRAAWSAAGAPGRLEIVTGGAGAHQLRNLYAAAHVLVVPSIRTRDFREPWGLVVNEAMNQRTAIVASDQVGAAAGGLVRHERNGLIFPAGDVAALGRAITRLRRDRELRDRLGAAGARDVAAYTHEAWAEGFAAAVREARGC